MKKDIAKNEISKEIELNEELTEETLEIVDGGTNKFLCDSAILTGLAGVACIMGGMYPIGFALLGSSATLGVGGLTE